MKKEEIKKPNPAALEEAVKIISDLRKTIPSDGFINSIEETDEKKDKPTQLPQVASPHKEDGFNIAH